MTPVATTELVAVVDPHAQELPSALGKLHNLSQLQKANPDKFAPRADTRARLLA